MYYTKDPQILKAFNLQLDESLDGIVHNHCWLL